MKKIGLREYLHTLLIYSMNLDHKVEPFMVQLSSYDREFVEDINMCFIQPGVLHNLILNDRLIKPVEIRHPITKYRVDTKPTLTMLIKEILSNYDAGLPIKEFDWFDNTHSLLDSCIDISKLLYFNNKKGIENDFERT